MLGVAALLGPWAAHLDRGSSFLSLLRGDLPQRQIPARKARSRDGSVASRSTPATKPARLLAGTGWSIKYSKEKGSSSRNLKNRNTFLKNDIIYFPADMRSRLQVGGLKGRQRNH